MALNFLSCGTSHQLRHNAFPLLRPRCDPDTWLSYENLRSISRISAVRLFSSWKTKHTMGTPQPADRKTSPHSAVHRRQSSADLGMMDFRKAYRFGVRFHPDNPPAPPEDQQPLVRDSFCKPAGGVGACACPSRDREAERSSPGVTHGPMAGSFCKPAPSPAAVSTKFPRNAPCSCGSGKKYKRCCGFNVAPAASAPLDKAA